MQDGVRVDQVGYGGWLNCYRLYNGLVDLIVTTDVGPRIIRLGFVGAENEFHEYAEALGKTGGDEWRNYGGHRLWHAPEVVPRTYHPDNEPVQWEEHAGFVRVIQATDTTACIRKELDIRLWPHDPQVQVTHRLRNENPWAVELAPWALSVMAPGGTAILPLPPRGAHDEFLLPTNTITLWAYTDMSDPRFHWGRKYVLARQDPQARSQQKVGLWAPDGWAAYARNSHLFVVTFEPVPAARYPDLGCCLETWIDAEMLELETLGPLTRLEPGAAVEHVEHWWLFDGVGLPESDEDVDQAVLPRVRGMRCG